jgi:hypothetical protein
MMATVANGGTLLTPHLAKAFDNGDGKGWQPFVPPAPRSRLTITPDKLQAVRDGLWMVVNGRRHGRPRAHRRLRRGRQDGNGAGRLESEQGAGDQPRHGHARQRLVRVLSRRATIRRSPA